MSQDSCDDQDDDPAPQSAVVEAHGGRPGTKEGQNNQELSKLPIWKRLTFWSVLSSCILTVITVILVLIAKWQLEVSKEAVNISNRAVIISESANKISAEALSVSQQSTRISEQSLRVSDQTLKMGERAWVTITKGQATLPIASGVAPEIRIMVHNHGRSPALRTMILQTVDFIDKLPDGPMPKPTKGSDSLSIVGPDTPMVNSYKFKQALTEERFAELKSGRLHMVTYGVVSYSDIFDAKHQTVFCLVLKDIQKAELSPCSKWNDAN